AVLISVSGRAAPRAQPSQEVRMSATGDLNSTAHNGSPLRMLSRDDLEREVRRRVDAERQRLEGTTPAPAREHFKRPAERPFTAAERNQVTILFGGLTW